MRRERRDQHHGEAARPTKAGERELGRAREVAPPDDAEDGHVQVFTLGTTAPASAVMDLASARNVQLVPVDDKTMGELKKMNAGYNKLIIKAGRLEQVCGDCQWSYICSEKCK